MMSHSNNTLPYEMITMPEQGTPEWHEIRRGFVGGSESAASVGLSEWTTAQHLHAIKCGLAKPAEPNRAMRAGTAMEAFIASEFELETGKKGFKPPFMAVSKEYPWMSANMDWLSVCQTEGADFKNSAISKKWGAEDTDEFPVDYFLQCQHTMVVVPTVKVMYLYVMLPFYQSKIYLIHPDLETQAGIIKGTKAFWDMVQSGGVPAFDFDHPEALSEIKSRYSTVEDKCVVLPESRALTVEKYMDVKEKIKSLKAQESSLQAVLLESLGDAQRGEVPGLWTLKRTMISKKPYVVNPKPYITLSVAPFKEKK